MGDSRKYKAGLAMSQRQLSADKLQEIQKLAAGWGKIIARRVCDDDPGNTLDFQAME